MSSDFAGALAYAFIFLVIPSTIYKTFSSRVSLTIAIVSTIVLGMSWGEWVGYLVQQRLSQEGIFTTGIVIAEWQSRTRNGGQEKLVKLKFESPSGIHQTGTYKITKNLHKGDSVIVRYAFSNPNIYHIEGLDN